MPQIIDQREQDRFPMPIGRSLAYANTGPQQRQRTESVFEGAGRLAKGLFSGGPQGLVWEARNPPQHSSLYKPPPGDRVSLGAFGDNGAQQLAYSPSKNRFYFDDKKIKAVPGRFLMQLQQQQAGAEADAEKMQWERGLDMAKEQRAWETQSRYERAEQRAESKFEAWNQDREADRQFKAEVRQREMQEDQAVAETNSALLQAVTEQLENEGVGFGDEELKGLASGAREIAPNQYRLMLESVQEAKLSGAEPDLTPVYSVSAESRKIRYDDTLRYADQRLENTDAQIRKLQDPEAWTDEDGYQIERPPDWQEQLAEKLLVSKQLRLKREITRHKQALSWEAGPRNVFEWDAHPQYGAGMPERSVVNNVFRLATIMFQSEYGRPPANDPADLQAIGMLAETLLSELGWSMGDNENATSTESQPVAGQAGSVGR